MHELLTSSLRTISAIVGIIAGVSSVLLIFWKNPFHKPKLEFTFWAPLQVSKEDFTRKQLKLIKQNDISLIAFAPQKKSTKPHIGVMFFSIQNRGKEPLKNVKLMLEYSSDFFVNNNLFESIIFFEPTLQSDDNKIVIVQNDQSLTKEEIKKLLSSRNASITPYGKAQVYYDIPIVRPGEGLILYDILSFRKGVIAGTEILGLHEEGFSHIQKIISSINGIDNYLVMNAWVYSENFAAQNKKISIIRFAPGINHDEILGEYLKALWFGEYPKHGFYHYNPIIGMIRRKLKKIGRLSSKLQKEELGLHVVSNSVNIKAKEGNSYTLEDFEHQQYQYFSFTSPNCDYLYLPLHVDSHIKLLRWLGIDLIFSPSKWLNSRKK